MDSKPSNLPKELQELQQSREGLYGPWRDNMDGTSLQMEGMLLNYIATQFDYAAPGDRELPKWWAPLCLCAVKLNRIASGNFHQDNFDDLRVYLSFVETMQKESLNDQTKKS